MITKYVVKTKLRNGQIALTNLLSAAIDVVDKDELASLENEDWNKLDLKYWTSRGYYFKSEEEERAEWNKIVDIVTSDDWLTPRGVIIIPTFNCNLRCTYCYQDDSIHTSPIRTKDVLSKDQLYAILETIDSRPDTKRYLTAVLCGGEPLMPSCYDIVEEILDQLEKRKIATSIVTNGLTLTEAIDKFLNRFKNIENIQVTLDGPEIVHNKLRPLRKGEGSFRNIVSGIEQSLNKMTNTRISVRSNINTKDPNSLSGIKALHDYYSKRGWYDHKNFFPRVSPRWEYERHGCYAAECKKNFTSDFRRIAEYYKENFPLEVQIRWGIAFFWQRDFLLSQVFGTNPVLPKVKSCLATTEGSYVFGPDSKIYSCWEDIGVVKEAIGEYYPKWSINKENYSLWKGRSKLTVEDCKNCKFIFACGRCQATARNLHNDINTKGCVNPEEEEELLKYILPNLLNSYEVSGQSDLK